MGCQAWSTIALSLVGAVLMILLGFAQETQASFIDSELEYDESPANTFVGFLSDIRSGGPVKCPATSRRCRKAGGVCVEAGTCDTVAIAGSSCSKIGDSQTTNCTCCAKDMSGTICKPKKSCKELGGFCVVNPMACRGEVVYMKGGCSCKSWSNRGSCCKRNVYCDEINCVANATCADNDGTTHGKCTCNEGFVTHDGECKPLCSKISCGANARCDDASGAEPGVCICDDGYVMHEGGCEPLCSKISCGANEICDDASGAEPGVCICDDGYVMHEGGCEPLCSSSMMPACGVNEICDDASGTEPGVCICIEGHFWLCDQCKVPEFETLSSGKLVRRTVSCDPQGDYDSAISFCDSFQTVPLIPRTEDEVNLYYEVRQAIGMMWLPANDRQLQGTMKWEDDELATDAEIALLPWYNGVKLYGMTDLGKDCLNYGAVYSGVPRVFFHQCTQVRYPPICVKA